MTQQNPRGPANWGTPPPPKKKRLSRTATFAIAAGVAGLIVGAISGAAAQGEKPKPEVRTVEKPGSERVRTETRTVTKEVTPESCIEALRLADKGFDIASTGFSIVSDMLTALGNADYETVTAKTAELRGETAKIGDITGPYNTAKSECRS